MFAFMGIFYKLLQAAVELFYSQEAFLSRH